jgi:DNA-damage-inducible protein D
MSETHLAIFKGQKIRKTIHENEWWFVVNDVISALTKTRNIRSYMRKMRSRDNDLSKGWGQIVTPLSIETSGGTQKLSCANTEGIFRIIQSIPSPKAEPFKRWLAKVGYERVQEIENPELATERTKAIYRAKGYSDAWIEKRMRGIAVRAELTDEWKKRDIKEDPEYAILTAEISKAAFGMTPREYKEFKGLGRENLRDHMTDLELIFSMLGEAATTEITRVHDARGFEENKVTSQKGGKIAGEAREKLEIETSKKVMSEENYLSEPERVKRLK